MNDLIIWIYPFLFEDFCKGGTSSTGDVEFLSVSFLVISCLYVAPLSVLLYVVFEGGNLAVDPATVTTNMALTLKMKISNK